MNKSHLSWSKIKENSKKQLDKEKVALEILKKKDEQIVHSKDIQNI